MMGCAVYARKDVKTRKVHTCAYCQSEIKAGANCLTENGIFDHKAFRRYCCRDCEPFIDGFWDYVDNEAYDISDQFYDYVRFENIPHPKINISVDCPNCGWVWVNPLDWEEGMAECPKCGTTMEPMESEYDG